MSNQSRLDLFFTIQKTVAEKLRHDSEVKIVSKLEFMFSKNVESRNYRLRITTSTHQPLTVRLRKMDPMLQRELQEEVYFHVSECRILKKIFRKERGACFGPKSGEDKRHRETNYPRQTAIISRTLFVVWKIETSIP